MLVCALLFAGVCAHAGTGKFDRIKVLAEAQGEVSVLVDLAVPHDARRDDHRAFATQTAALVRAQRALLDDLGDAVRAHRKLYYVPTMSLVIEPSALKALVDHPLVADVREDGSMVPHLAAASNRACCSFAMYPSSTRALASPRAIRP